MTRTRRFVIPTVLLFVLLIALPFIVAFRQVLPPEVEQVIFYVITLIVGWVGPFPLEWLFSRINVSGTVAVVITYAIALVIGAIGVYAASVFLGFALPTDFFGLAFLLLLASQVSFNRLKDNPKTAARFG